MQGEVYDADYFLHGRESGKSLYENYRWLPELTIPMALSIMEHLQIGEKDTVCDFGCARGYTVKAMRLMQIEAYGVDISEWARENADPMVKGFILSDLRDTYDWIIAKDVLEHVPADQLPALAASMLNLANKGVFVVVPLSPEPNAPYVCPEYEQDVTHVVRWDIDTWVDLFKKADPEDQFTVEAAYNVPGIKENYAHFPEANGFITMRVK